MKPLNFLASLLLVGATALSPAAAAVQPAAVAPAATPSLPTPAPEELRSAAKANRSFGVRLYKQLAKEPGNVFISPVSIAAAFGPVALGARADTYMAIGRTLGFRVDPKL